MKEQADGILNSYRMEGSHFDEVFVNMKTPKEHYQTIVERFNQLSLADFERIYNEVKTAFFNQGITFAVYSNDKKADERIFPFDLFPRIISKQEWHQLETGVIQRNKAINLFLHDIYHKKLILKDKVVPADLIFSSKNYLKEMIDFTPKYGCKFHLPG